MKYLGHEIEMKAICFVFGGEDAVQDGIVQDGILLHDVTDGCHDGDTVYGNGWTVDQIEDDSDLESLITSGDGTTQWHKLDNGVYVIEA